MILNSPVQRTHVLPKLLQETAPHQLLPFFDSHDEQAQLYLMVDIEREPYFCVSRWWQSLVNWFTVGSKF